MYSPLPSASETAGQERIVEGLCDVQGSQMHIFLKDLCRAFRNFWILHPQRFLGLDWCPLERPIASVLGQNSLLLLFFLLKNNSSSMASSMSWKEVAGPREELGFPSLVVHKERLEKQLLGVLSSWPLARVWEWVGGGLAEFHGLETAVHPLVAMQILEGPENVSSFS